MSPHSELEGRLEAAARTGTLLVASDYDGTLSPIVENPSDATPVRESLVALRALASLPHTHVAIISGRALSELGRMTGSPDGILLVGSHGSEFEPDFARSLPEDVRLLRDKVGRELEKIAQLGPGLELEHKPAGVALHFRKASREDAAKACALVESGPATLEGVSIKHGKEVVELSVVKTSKGAALATIRQRVGAGVVVFIGDDVTDEDAFVTLGGPDIGIKVGAGETAARLRIDDVDEVARTLARLAELRGAWARGAEATPIQEHGLLSDQRTIGLVSPKGRIVWMCLPRIDSSALFAELLGGPAAGHFSISPVGGHAEPTQSYQGDTFHLCTDWGNVRVVDYLDCTGGRSSQRAGRTDLVRTIEGAGRVRIEFVPRLDFGRVPTRLARKDGGLTIDDSFDPVVLRSPGVEWEITREGDHDVATAEITLDGGPIRLVLRYGTGALSPAVVEESVRSNQTAALWSGWAAQLRLPSVEPELVKRSALTLKALCYGPTGAIAAAATTSLPESIGGVRNWDYRYCWPRDAAMAAMALVRLGSMSEAMALLDWLLGVLEREPSPDRLAPLYTITGGHLGPEAEISELSGYAGSRPVRVGNAASRQLQLDVFGPVVELIHELVVWGAPLSAEHWRLVQAMVEAVRSRWREPDHGIWEIRAEKRHHVHSKVMCWQTAKLGAKIAEQFAGVERPEWATLRDEIAADVLEHGWHKGRGAFSGYYGGEDADAAVLQVGLCGLVAGDDPRLAATVQDVEKTLLGGGTVYRYRGDDGLPGSEGGFNLCTSWLIRCYLLVGRVEDARELFKKYTACAGKTGLIPEEFDPETGRGLGNHPQAYSHLGLIQCALAIDRAGSAGS
ncbi:MAG: trehalose-phosphatase [Phycisphaerales bacterium]